MLPPLPPAADLAPPPLPPGALTEEAGRCANCLTPLVGPFCAQCGQHVADYHRSVWRFVVDFFDSAFCWDNKLFRTVGPLLKRPGWLTQEFMAGRRVRYVHPLRLFLFTSAVCLALLQWTHSLGGFQSHATRTKGSHRTASVDKLPDDDKNRPDSQETGGAQDDDAAADSAHSSGASPADSPAGQSLSGVLRDTMKNGARQSGKADPAAQAALDKHWEAFGDQMQKKIDAAGDLKKFNERVTTNVQSKLSWVALAMLPIFALFMRMAFGRSGGYYFTYLVFSLHYHTFLLMFWAAYSWVDVVAKWLHSDLLRLVAALCLFVPPWYLFRALQQMYGQAWVVTAGKVFAIGAVHLLTLFAGLAIIGATAFL